MQATYRTSHRNSQAEMPPDVESINILEIAYELDDAQVVQGFLDDIPTAPCPLLEIITAYEVGGIGVVEALGALEAYGILKSPEQLMDAFCVAKRVEYGLPLKGRPEAPTPVSDAIQRRMAGAA